MSVNKIKLLPLNYEDYFHNAKEYLKLIMKANPSDSVIKFMKKEILEILDEK